MPVHSLFQSLVLFVLIATSACAKIDIKKITYLDENTKLYNPKDLEEVLKNQTLSPIEQEDSLRSLKIAFKSSYIGYDLKKTLIGKSGEDIFSQCLNFTRVNRSNIEFYDLVKRCLSGFNDTHLNIKMMSLNTTISSPIGGATWIGKKFILSATRNNLIKKLIELGKLNELDAQNYLQLGSEILSIDGESPDRAIQKMSQYISASSPAALKAEAAVKVFTRNYAYPSQATFLISLKNRSGSLKTLEIPWVQNIKEESSLESRFHLGKLGLPQSNDLSNAKNILSKNGFDLYQPLFDNLTDKKTFFDSDDYEIIVGGKVNNQQLCYVQIFSFAVDRNEKGIYAIYKYANDQKQEIGFTEALKEILLDCEKSKLPLVLDLKENGGGNARVGDLTFLLFETAKTRPSYYAKATHNSRGNLAVFLNMILEIEPNQTQIYEDLYLQAYQTSLSQNEKITPWIVAGPINAERSIFTQPLLITTSNQCISACDNIVNRFKKSKRALILGEETNGTGFGFSSSDPGKTLFRDPLNLFEIGIPNHAFQIQIYNSKPNLNKDSENEGALIPFSEIKILENSPTKPDVYYSLSLADLFDFSDYQKAIFDNLSNLNNQLNH